jgi:hypothetical protein
LRAVPELRSGIDFPVDLRVIDEIAMGSSILAAVFLLGDQ